MTRARRGTPQPGPPTGYLVGPVIAVEPWPSLLVQAAWWIDPVTRHLPLAVITPTGAVRAASVEALAHGVAAEQTLAQARLRSPALRAVPPDHAVTAELWHRTLTALLTLSPTVEAADHGDSGVIAYVDGRGLDRLWGDTRAVAQRARQLLSDHGIAARVGAGPSRAVASALARRMDTAGPRVLSASEAHVFLAHLPLSDPLFTLEEAACADLGNLGVTTAAQLAVLSRDQVATRFGPAVLAAQDTARAADEPPLQAWTPPERIAIQGALDGAVDDRTVVDAVLVRACRELGTCLCASGRATHLLSLETTCEDAPPALRCLQPTVPLQETTALTVAARTLWASMRPPAPVLSVTLTAARIRHASARQETLFGEDAPPHGAAAPRAARLTELLQAHVAQFGAGRVRRPGRDPRDPQGWTWVDHEP